MKDYISVEDAKNTACVAANYVRNRITEDQIRVGGEGIVAKEGREVLERLEELIEDLGGW